MNQFTKNLDVRINHARYVEVREKVIARLSVQPSAVQWSASDVAEITGWKHEVVTHWCARKVMPSLQRPHAANQRFLISPRDLTKFLGSFVPTSHLANQMHTSPRSLRAHLTAAGIKIHGEKTVGKTSRGGLVSIRDLATVAIRASKKHRDQEYRREIESIIEMLKALQTRLERAERDGRKIDAEALKILPNMCVRLGSANFRVLGTSNKCHGDAGGKS